MAYDPGALETALAAAVGDDPALVMELRAVFLQSVMAHADAMKRAQTAADWQMATWRLKGVATSFGATRLMAVAENATASQLGDADILRKVDRAIARFRDSTARATLQPPDIRLTIPFCECWRGIRAGRSDHRERRGGRRQRSLGRTADRRPQRDRT